jgi:NADPH:quinone reductase-like Zn-dependent oxidoreductase
MILGCDGAGVDEDGQRGHRARRGALRRLGRRRDPRPARTLLSELYDGTLAEYVAVPSRNLVPKPAGLPFEHAACLSTAWLTAYRMLFVNAGLTLGPPSWCKAPAVASRRPDPARLGGRVPGLGHLA